MPSDGVDVWAELRADCSRCVGLCCVALPFARSADFAIDKPAGMPCPHLAPDDRCGIHARLRDEGFPGCDVFDCFGAGQQLVQVTFGGASRRDDGTVPAPMVEAFGTLRAVHEMRWYLADAAGRDLPPAMTDEVSSSADRLAAVSAAVPSRLATVDVAELRRRIGDLLGRVSATVRAGLAGVDRRGADLVGQSWAGAALRGADLRGTLLVGADLRGADLRTADLLGADLRGADLGGADLRAALFVTRPQVAAARGDRGTRIPPSVGRPAHWNRDESSLHPREP